MTVATRLALLNALVMALTATGVLAIVVLMTRHDMARHVEESVMAELNVLVAEYQIDGPVGLRGLVAFREAFNSANHGRIYRVEDRNGEWVAGSMNPWPAALQADGRLLRIPNPAHARPTEWVLAAAALPDGGRLLVGFDTLELRAVMSGLYRAAVIGMLVAMALALGFGITINRAALQPIATIRRSAQTIIDGDLSHRIPVRSHGDEFGALTLTLNGMLERIEHLVEAIRGTTDGIAHDLRSPLARHRARLEAALRAPPDRDHLEEWLHDTLDEIDQVLGTFNALLQLATVEAGAAREQFTRLSIEPIVRDAISLYEAQAQERDMSLTFTGAGVDLQVQGDRHLLFQSVINLLDNAIKYGPAGQTISVSLASEDGHAVLEVRDEGPGVSHPQQAFERLSRGDAARQTAGHGLGLPLVRAIARLHGGEAEIRPANPGARLRMRFPAA